ncbi:response regulator [Hyphobacterium sp. SN044]|uniref:response regulator n=1 Tax=Hyphobacterium sp. SN044 TaxID=2912575 RepID=UPI001F003A02|nr:response regulator [Hyphobacterium sp. SN044]
MGNLQFDTSEMLRDRKIMLVDDSAALRGALRSILSSLGAEQLTEAGDAGEALGALSCEGIDLLITDWKMEPLDGLALVRAIRAGKSATARDIPIVMLTSYTDARYQAEAMRAGVTCFMPKPFTARSLLEGLAAVLSGEATESAQSPAELAKTAEA